MTTVGAFQIVLYVGVLVALAKPLGSFMAVSSSPIQRDRVSS